MGGGPGGASDERSPRVAAYAESLTTLEDVFRADGFVGWTKEHGPLPVDRYTWFGLFARFLLEAGGYERLGPALPVAGDVTSLVRDGFGLEPGEALERYKGWLRGE